MLSFHPRQKATEQTTNNIELPLDEKPGIVPDDKRVVSLDEFRKKRNL